MSPASTPHDDRPVGRNPRAGRARGRRRRRALLVAAAVLALLLVGPSPAGAHTDLLQGSPGPGQRVGGEVDVIDLVFAEPVTEAAVTITGPDGEDIGGEMTAADGLIIRFSLDEPLTEPGDYQLDYEMISFDTDFTARGYNFTYDPSAPEPIRLGVEVEPEGTNWPMIIASVVLMAALAGLVFLFVKRTDAQRQQVGAGADDVTKSGDGEDAG
ncbi:MAG: copper resistance protein CopC [Actinomycetota bacterium]